MVFVNLLRHYVQQLIRNDKAIDVNEMKHKCVKARCLVCPEPPPPPLRRCDIYETHSRVTTRDVHFLADKRS